jgi:tRNA(fMet)-specific endonuclease VapC
MRYVLDTNILIHLVRDSDFGNKIADKFGFDNAENQLFISIVTKAEMLSLSMKSGWGNTKITTLNSILDNLIILNITESVVTKYVEIDAYSQAKHPTLKLKNTHRNMGKNDIWIAATTSAIFATLITTDGDFEHLNGVFFDLIKVNLDIK